MTLSDLQRRCTVQGCDSKYAAKGLCSKHYQKQLYHGTTGRRERILARNKLPEIRQQHSEYAKKQKVTLEGRFVAGKAKALKYGQCWEILFEEFSALLSQTCTYCAHTLLEKGTRIGLDRIDNSRGYSLENVVPCCGTCNMARGTRFSYAEMVEEIGPAIRRIREARAGSSSIRSVG